MAKAKRFFEKPPFLKGGNFIADGVVRDANGYPLDDNGSIDLDAAKKEMLKYQKNALNKGGTNRTPPKKKR